MRALVRTLPLYAILVGSSAILGACDTSVTRPEPEAAKPDAIIVGIGTCWCRTVLPFAPSAINDAGVVVGTSGGEAVVWTNGVLDTLPHSVALAGPYSAVDISPNGTILGSANGHAIFWQSDTLPPNDASAGFTGGSITPVAINDSHTIVGIGFQGYGFTSYRWTPTGGWVNIGFGPGYYNSDETVVTSLNAYGQAAGYYVRYGFSARPVRWSATATTPDTLPAPLDWNGYPSGSALSIDGSDNIFGYTSAGPTLWNASKVATLVTGLPSQPTVRSNAGRFIGVAYNAGVLQPFTSFNGALTWLSNPDATAPTMVDVNSCGTIIGKRATSPATGYLWKRTSIMYTCDVQQALLY